jgi:transcriptional regulator with XRE-family HTH domain
MLDFVIRLREARRLKGLSQKQVAQLSGVGEKTISSFESGHRIDSLKVNQLAKILSVYGLTLEHFFSVSFERRICGEVLERDEELSGIDRLLSAITSVDDERRPRLVQSLVTVAEMSKRQSDRRGHRLT